MSSSGGCISLFVLVECEPYSSHRDPKGVYKVDLMEESTILHNACAAVQIVKEYAPFMDENINKARLRVFSHEGNEINIPTQVNPQFLEMGLFLGRVEDFPEMITIQ